MTNTKEIRKPAVAGFFYPRNAGELAADVDRMIEAADPPALRGRVRVLVSPHAGYKYSGRVAAHGFRLVRGGDFHTAIVISPSHVEHFGYSAVFDGGGYETPLGVAATAPEASERVAGVNRRVIKSSHGHEQAHMPRQEHALEVQLPFLQRTLSSFELVAIVMGDQSWDNCAALGEALRPLAKDPGVLIVASTDLSHFYDAGQADSLDARFSDILTTMDAGALYEAVQKGTCEACGAGPVIASLLATEGLEERSCTTLSRRNSGDVTGDYSGVVGYLSAAVTARQEDTDHDR